MASSPGIKGSQQVSDYPQSLCKGYRPLPFWRWSSPEIDQQLNDSLLKLFLFQRFCVSDRNINVNTRSNMNYVGVLISNKTIQPNAIKANLLSKNTKSL